MIQRAVWQEGGPVADIKQLDSGLWQARWRDPSGKQKKKSFEKKRDAERFMVSVSNAKQTGTYVDPHDKTTVIGFVEKWAASRSYRSRTARRAQEQIDTHIKPTNLGQMRLAA